MPNLRHHTVSSGTLPCFGEPPGCARADRKAALTDTECLSCHGQSELKSESGHSVFVNEAKHKASVHGELTCFTCHTDVREFPHPAHVAKVQCSSCHVEENSDALKRRPLHPRKPIVHKLHGSAHEAQAASRVMPRQCNMCHAKEVKALLTSAHRQAAKKGDPQSPTCESCHGPIHKVLSSQDPLSP